jgi:hypothetical protein
MSELHPALAYLRERMRAGQAMGTDTLVLDVAGSRVELFVAPSDSRRAFFSAGATKLSYRCPGTLSDTAKQPLRELLLEARELLSAGRIAAPSDPLPEAGGWTDAVRAGDLQTWRDWVTRNYRAAVEGGRQQSFCAGLPECLDLRMRPPIQSSWADIGAAPARGPCADCGRARGCFAADAANAGLAPLRHADAAGAEVAALRALATAAAVPLDRALDAYSALNDTCGDRAVVGSMPLEYSIRLPTGERRPDRLRFVSYYPLVGSDDLRREVSRGRRIAIRTLAREWCGADATSHLDAWLQCAAQTQPDTLGLSIGIDMDRERLRLQVYAHPEPNDDGIRFADAVTTALGGDIDSIPKPAAPAVLVGLALAPDSAPALKLYYQRRWHERGDTGLLGGGLGALEEFNPGWGLAIQEHLDGRAEFVKWDFPVTAHFQDYPRFLAAFGAATSADPMPAWLSGKHFSPWPTWASLGRGGWALYFQAR